MRKIIFSVLIFLTSNSLFALPTEKEGLVLSNRDYIAGGCKRPKQGPPGPTGPTGPAGAPGTIGPTGPTGPAGGVLSTFGTFVTTQVGILAAAAPGNGLRLLFPGVIPPGQLVPLEITVSSSNIEPVPPLPGEDISSYAVLESGFYQITFGLSSQTTGVRYSLVINSGLPTEQIVLNHTISTAFEFSTFSIIYPLNAGDTISLRNTSIMGDIVLGTELSGVEGDVTAFLTVVKISNNLPI